jgi:rare lipoprotein A
MDDIRQHFSHVRYLILLCFMIFLTSCSHVTKKDGPPNFYVDETKIPNAVPKPEPLAKYGNMKSYVVFGKRYYVMKNNSHYNEVGIASWYGTKFHARRTSSGERYNMLGMTAAHKTLPLPTYVEVTNLKNHRSIIVKVNDRGPFADKRIIDLTYVAAKKLGMIGKGTTYVRVKAINPLNYGKPIMTARRVQHTQKVMLSAHKPANHHEPVYLQVGAFHDKSRATKLQKRLSGLVSLPVNIYHRGDKGALYRVKIGPIHDVSIAEEITSQLKGLGMNTNKSYGA